MHPSGSFIDTVLERARALAEEPTADSQYDDNFLVRQVVGPEFSNVMGLVSLGAENPFVMRLQVDVRAGTQYYELPPAVRQVWRLARRIDGDKLVSDFFPRGWAHPLGMGWNLEGRMLSFDPVPTRDETWYVWYIPSVDFTLHKGTGTVQESSANPPLWPRRTRIKLAASPSVGVLDRRNNAYVGAVLRIIQPGITWQERLIVAHDASAGKLTVDVRIPFEEANWPGHGGSVNYEIAPVGWQALWDAVAIRTAIRIGTMRNQSEKKLALLEGQFARSIKAIRDQLGNFQGRRGKGFDPNTPDNPDYIDIGHVWGTSGLFGV